jgi:GT2 family glycosyltransferase
VDGKFFRLGEQKFFVKGVAYGPFMPDAQGQPFASPEQTALDLARIAELGANVVRVYHPPPRWFLDAAEEHGLKVFVDVPWNKHLCFDSPARRRDAREAVRRAVHACARHPAVFAFSVANEIPAEIVRWMGAKAVARFIDELTSVAKRADPACLCTFANFPPTEFLRPRNPDFVCFNVYLHNRRPFQDYLARLQMLADSKPLLLGESGIDSLREGEGRQREILSWQIEDAFRGGLAGTVVFTFADEWCKDGRLVEDWRMGLVTRDRQPKESFDAVRKMFLAAPYFDGNRSGAPVSDPARAETPAKDTGSETGARPPARDPRRRFPRVSVVVASYNGDQTLNSCLTSLQRLNYPDCEIILVDDGSTDTTAKIAQAHPVVRLIRHPWNLGLSAARNTGIAAATGEIIAFTDADCRADEDWLRYLVGDLLNSDFAGIGGPNLLPPEDSLVAAAVMVSPGGPAHVMLTDRQAEHIPGCNMAFHKWALEEVGGFDPVFRKAGDDVDLCWRLQQAGYRIGFSPAAFVWHYRRSTIRAYLKQQRGYGEAEALLAQKHPENFSSFGGGIWRGRIYGASKFGVELQPPVIYHGLFGSAGFQKLYTSQPVTLLMFCTTLEYYVFVSAPLWILSLIFEPLLPLAIASLLLSLGVCAAAAAQADLPARRTRWWSRPLVALLFLLQPVVRGWARYRSRINPQPLPLSSQQSLDSLALRSGEQPLDEVQYWAQQRMDRLDFVAAILRRLNEKGWAARSDVGWSEYDLEIQGSRWSRLELTTVAEDHPENRQTIRCRLRARWSLAARIVFGSLLGFELLIIGLMDSWWPWSWLGLLTLPVCVWFLAFDGRNLQSVVVAFLDELARERGLEKTGK